MPTNCLSIRSENSRQQLLFYLFFTYFYFIYFIYLFYLFILKIGFILSIKTKEESMIKLTKLNRLLNLFFKALWNTGNLTSLFIMHLSCTNVGQSSETHWSQPLRDVQLLMCQKIQHVRFYLSCKSQSGSQEVQSMGHYTPHKLRAFYTKEFESLTLSGLIQNIKA